MSPFSAAVVLALVAGAAADRPAPTACSAAVHRQLDFWVGEWSVIDRVTGHYAGSSHIELLYGGCVIRENWVSDGFRGGSLNSYWSGDRKWHQTWMDSAGAFRHFIGGLDKDGRMVLTAQVPNGDKGPERLVRLTFTSNGDKTVRQYSDFSDDGGRSWKVRYDLLYRPLSSR